MTFNAGCLITGVAFISVIAWQIFSFPKAVLTGQSPWHWHQKRHLSLISAPPPIGLSVAREHRGEGGICLSNFGKYNISPMALNGTK